MARRGPKPRLKAFDPVTSPGMPSKPAGLDDATSKAWDELAVILAERDSLTPGDAIALEMLASALAGWRIALSAAAEAGPATESAGGASFKESPEALGLARTTKYLLTLLQEFGLTPRSRLDVRSSSEGGGKGTDGYAKFKAMLGRAKA
jgi:P27 family predicted phage terminase small subunit